MIINILKLLIAVLLGSAGQLLFKLGAKNLGAGILSMIISFITNIYLFLGVLCYGISTLIYVNVLQKMPLSLAYPFISISYVFVLLLSYLFLGENLNAYKIIGVSFIVLGVCTLYLR